MISSVLAVLLAHVAVELPAGLVEQLRRACRVVLADVAGVVLVALLVRHEDVVAERLSASMPSGPSIALAIAARSIAIASAWRTLTSCRIGAGAVDRDVPEVRSAGHADLGARDALGARVLVDVGADVHEVDLAVGERVDLRVGVDRAEDDRVELGRFAPPLLVAHERERLGRLVDAARA